ncbi:MFS transporter [Calidifontibacter terrae]
MTDTLLRLSEPAGRRLLATAVTGSGLVFLDGTVANVALPRIGADLGAELAGLQWVINAYTLTLAALIIVGGSLGDRFGRKRVFAWGTAGFAVASVLVALAPTIGTLIGARALQGIAAALLTPGSLAMLQASFHPEDRMKAIGAWTGTLGIATAAGPVLGGWLVGIDWRIAFWINLPIALIVLWLLRPAPETSDPGAARHIDLPALILTPLTLAALTWALTVGATASGLIAAVVAVVAAIAFIAAELHARHPMVPPRLFRSRVFCVINLVTLFVYGALTGSMLFLAVFLQVSAGWSPLEAGAATVPVSIAMLLLASWFGGFATRHGARLPMVAGMVVLATGLALLAFAPEHPSYAVHILPGVVLQGLGLSMLVAPLTGTVLAAVPDSQSGVASGINNAISRTAGLIAVAALPTVVGLSGAAYRDPVAVAHAYTSALWWCVGAVLIGAILTAVGLTARQPK